MTGLPYKTEKPTTVNPITNKPYQKSALSTAPTAYDFGQRDRIDRYQDYGVALRQGADWDEMRAQRQSTAEKWGRGLAKGLVTTVGAVADNTIGVLSGIGEAIYHGDSTKLYDNSVGRSVDKMNAWMQDNFANYYTKAEQEAEGLASLGYANFWADKVTNGLGYAVGSVGTVLATGGAGLLTRGAGLVSKGLKAYNGAKAISTGAGAASALGQSARAGRALNALRTAEIGMMMSYGESAVEARETLHRVTENLTQQRADELGIDVSQLSAAELADIKDTAAHAGNMAFGLNMAVLSTTNLITFGKMLLPKYTQMRPKMRGIGRDAKTGKVTDFWKDNPKWGGIADRYLKEPAKSGLSEAFQEGTQFVIQDAADVVSSNVGRGTTTEWAEALMGGYGEAFGTKEGKESMMLGAIIGMMMGGFGSVKEYMNETEVDEQRSKILQSLNNDNFNNYLERAKSAGVSEEYTQKMQDALEQGDHKSFRDMQFKLIMNEVAMHERAGTLDMFMERIDDAAGMEDAEFAEAFGIPEGTNFDKTAIVSGLKDKVKDYRKLKEQVDAAFPTRPKEGIDRLLMSKEEKEAEEGRLADEQKLKNYVMAYGLELEDSDGRMESLINELNEGAESTLSMKDFSEFGPIAEIEEIGEDQTVKITEGKLNLSESARDKLNDIVMKEENPQKRAELLNKAQDLVRIAASRQVAISALNELYGDPATRSVAMAREKQKEVAKRQQKIDNDVKQRIAETNTYEELVALEEALKGQPNISPELQAELNKELSNRAKEQARLVKEYRYSSVEELERKLANETDPVKKAALKEAIKLNNETGNPGGMARPEEDKAPTTEEERKSRAEERKKQREEKTNRNQENEEEPTKGEVTGPETKPAEQGTTVQIANGEYKLQRTPSGEYTGKVLIGPDGKPLRGNDSNMSPEVPVNRAKLTEEGAKDKPVELKLLPETNYQPVGVFMDGELVGVLQGKNSGAVVARLKAGETVTGTISTLEFGNFNNGVLDEFSNDGVLADAEGNLPMAMRPASELSKMNGFVQYVVMRGNEIGLSEETEEGLAGKADYENRITHTQNFAPGQILAMFRKPTGEYTIIPVSTKQIGETGANQLAEMLINNAELELIKDTFGIAGQASADINFMVEQTQDGDLLISFRMGDQVISYNSQEFAKMMNGEPALFSVGNYQETLDENGDASVTFQKTGDVTQQERAEIAGQAKQEAMRIMAGVRTQVDIKAMADPAYRQSAEKNDLETDIFPGAGNVPFHDPKVVITLDGETKEAVDNSTPPVKEPVPVSTREENQEVPAADTEYSEDDLFGAPAEEEAPITKDDLKQTALNASGVGPTANLPENQVGRNFGNLNLDGLWDKTQKEMFDEFWETAEQFIERGKSWEEFSKFAQRAMGINVAASGGSLYKALYNQMLNDDYTDLALRLGERDTTAGNTEAAKKFLQERFGEDSVTIFNTMQMVGDAVVHGYVQNGAVHLWNNAEVGTEYHEGFHMFFRTMLTDEQRTQLYNDAAEQFGEPTAEEIAAARRGQSELTDAEARLLALEEKMAEEFRGYMLNEEEVSRTLPQRIAKFFKDMLAYIKAVITDRVSVNQAFSLIEKNRIPKKFSRNAKAFSPGDAFMLQQYASNPQMHTELIDTAVYIALNSMGEGATESDLLGSQLAEDESELRNWFLRNSMHKPGGMPMSDTEFADLKNAYDQGVAQAREVIQRLGLRPGAPLVDTVGKSMPAQVAQNAAASAHFRSVYDRWFDVEAELGGTKLRGFRSDVAERLKTYGFNPTSREFERIYGLSRMKENPAQKLNDKTKRMLSRIPVSSTENTYFGFQTYVPIMDIYTEIAGSVYNSADIDSMLERLEIRSRHIPHLRDVYNFVNNLSDQEKALFYSSMALTMNEFRMMIIDNDENGNRFVRILNPGATSIESFYADKWKTKSRGPGGMYSVTVEDGVPSVTVNQDKKTRAVNFLKAALSETGAGVTDVQYNALANGLWELGIELGGTKELARENVKKTFDGFSSAKWTRFTGESGANIREILNDIQGGKDVHTESGGRVRTIADVITKNFVAPPAMSFVNGAGSLVFPLNQKTDLDITKELIESGEYAEMMDGAVGHTAGETKSFATVIVSNERFQKEFVPVDFDSVKITNPRTEKTELYENDDLTFEESLAVEMNMFRNPSNPDLLYIPLDTQGDRNRLTFIPVPNFLNTTRSFDARYKLGLDGMSKEERVRKILTDQILVDLNRIDAALQSPSEIKGYHTRQQFRNLQTGGRLEADQNNIARQAAVYAEGNQETMPEELAKFVDAEIKNLLEQRDGYVAEVVQELGSEEKLRQFLDKNVPGVKTGQEIAFLEDYITSNMIGRMVSREIFRSGVNYVKDGADYNKRSAHTTTPGTVLMIQREEGGYGMKPNFTEITVQDILKSLPEEDLAAFRDQLVTNGLTPEQAETMVNTYRGIETTDAQAFITMDMYRSIRQGMGMWTEKDESMYEDFQKTGKWKGKLKPLKPSYEFRVEHNGHLLPIMHKNSYIVLTPELVEGIAPLTQLYDRMTAQGEFEGLEKVDVVNTESAKKLATFDPVDGTSAEALRGVPVQTLDSRGFKLPQILPESFKDQITFGRQPRKNMIANIDNNTTYTFNGQEISGADLKALYQSALVAKLRLNQEKVFKELGYDAVINAETEAGKIKAIQSMLPKLRKKMEQLGVEKDYTQNFLDALQLTKDQDGNLTTRMPLSFPAVHSKLDQLLLGLFRTEVYQQRLAGQEMVQFSEFGASETGEDLAFYSVLGTQITEAEVDVHPAVLKKMGVDINQPIEEINRQVQRLLGYRIPQQGKSSMLVMKIRKLLPESAVSSIRVPAGITTMMGSDFDIDKMFVVFPELEDGQRVEFDVNQDPSTMTEKQLNNMIFETFAAVGTNVAHLDEILGGVEIADLDAARAALGKSKADIDINSPVQRIQTGIDNMLSLALRGIYANAIAGRNVAQASGVAWVSSPGREMIVNGQTLDRIVDRSPFTNKYTDQYMSQYLSGAIDSVKDPLQEQINDNKMTASLTNYMISLGMTPTQAVAFLNVPAVKAVTDQARGEGISLGMELRKRGAEAEQIILNEEEMLKAARGEKVDYDEESYVNMLAMMHEEARALGNLYTALTPDAIDKAGTTAQHLAMLDNLQELEGKTFGGPAALREVIEGDAYPITREYYEAIKQSLEVGRRVGFIGTQPGVMQFKQKLKGLLGKTEFNEQQHRDINRAILHYMVTQPGSPIFESGLLDTNRIQNLHLEGGIGVALQEAKEALKGGETNVVLDSLEVITEPLENGDTLTYLQVDPTKVRTKLEKEIWTATMEGMVKDRERFAVINNAIFSNMIITSGFAPGPFAAFDLLPISMFEQLGVTTHLNKEMKKLEQGDNYLDRIGFTEEFMSSYGTHRVGKENLIDNKVSVTAFALSGILKDGYPVKDRKDKYLVVTQGKEKHLFVKQGNRYMPALTKGRQYMFYEANLRDSATGEKHHGSVLFGKRTSSPNTVQESRTLPLTKTEKPAGAQAKIKRLTESFAAAGIDVRVVQAELPAGVKGQVENGVITIDPNQLTEDTVYHEFGHILVDMLPEAEVRKYVQQVVKADPTLARTVKAEYPELEGLELGKEILVTAIGLEGAKLERKNPSKLQRLVNKILRAIGKLFGVQPNAAAVLAEQMFGAEIKAEQLSGKFNRKLQNSRDLRDELTAVSEDTLKSLKRQQIRLENLPESEQTRERLREIKTLERNIRKIQNREDELNAFMDFADYAFARINRLDLLMGRIQEKAKDPNLTQAEKFELLNQIGEMKQTLDSLYNTRAEKSTITKMGDLLSRTKFEGQTEETTEQVKRLLNDLDETLRDARRLEQEFSDVVLPIVADVLLTYATPEINDQIDEDIQRIRETKDISGYGRFAVLQNNPAHKQLRARLRNGEITKEEFREQALEMKIEDLKNKRVGRAQLVQEMRDAHNSKSWFSHMMDPMVYSNEANLQLFSLAVKDAVNNATEKSRGFLYELEEQYNDFKSFMGSDFNEAKFNDDLLTTVTIDGVEQLALVSEYDTQRFYAARDAELARLNSKYKVPEDRAEYDDWKFDAESGKLSQAYRDHRRELIVWYKNNTTAAPGAEQTLAALNQKIATLQQKIDVEEDRDVKNIMITEIKELQEKLYRSYSRTGVFMEEMAVPNDTYLSEKYQKIQATPELKKYYDFIVQRYELAQKQIGNSQLYINSWDTMSYIMPTVRKDRLAALQQEGWKDLAKEELKDFTRLDTDTQFGMMTDADGERVRSIPRFYTNRVQAKDVSRDIAASMAQFVHMANLFEEKSKTVGLVESMMSIHEQRLTIPRDSKTGLPIIDKVSEMARGVQGDVVKEDPRNNRNYQHLREFVDSVFYGQLDLEQGAILGVDMSKLAGKAAAFTAVTNLAFNTLQVGNQFVLDNLMGSEEAVAGQFFGKRDFAWAAKTYAANKGALSDLGAFVPKSKLGQAMMMFDALNEVTDSIGKGVTGSKLKKAMQGDPFFALQHAVEHQATGTRMLALLRSYKGKLKDSKGNVLLNEKGEEADLWDMLVKDEKGKFIIDPRVANVNKNAVIAKLHGINKRANQIKGSHDRSMGNRRALGKLALLFRNYFVPGLRKRFGHGESVHVDYELGSITRGMYQSLMGYFSLIPYEGVTAYQMMSETDKQNLRRATYEAAATVASLTTFLVLNSMLDDDDEDNYAIAYAAYQARRLQSELLQFVNPSEFLRMAQSPMATVNWLDKYATVIGQVAFKEPGYALGIVDEDEIFYQRRTGTAEKGDRKVMAQLKKIIPVLNGYQTSFLRDGGAEAVEEKLRWFN